MWARTAISGLTTFDRTAVTLARALVLLSLRSEEWREPHRQEYVRNVLDFFHRRLITGLQRGGLVRMTIGRTTARLDLTELAGPARSAQRPSLGQSLRARVNPWRSTRRLCSPICSASNVSGV